MLNPLDFEITYHTQSSNSSAKIALCIDEFYHNYQEFIFQNNFGWNQLQDTVLFTTYDSFLFIDNSFYYQMLKKVINDLIPTGIMNHLIENHYTKKINFAKVENQPQVLNVDELLFGFKIWLASCLTSVIAFIGESLMMCFKSKYRTLKFAKVHPSNERLEFFQCKLKLELINKFRVKSSEELNEVFLNII